MSLNYAINKPEWIIYRKWCYLGYFWNSHLHTLYTVNRTLLFLPLPYGEMVSTTVNKWFSKETDIKWAKANTSALEHKNKNNCSLPFFLKARFRLLARDMAIVAYFLSISQLSYSLKVNEKEKIYIHLRLRGWDITIF